MTQTAPDAIAVPPMDRYNQDLINNLHPPDWKNPTPIDRYNLVVIGAGTAGLVTAAGAALLGAKVALIEKHLMGGDCTNVGCVPSKTMIRSARVVADMRRAEEFGIQAGDLSIDFARVMERLRQIRATISPHDSAKRFQTEFGVDVFFGAAKFVASDAIEVAGSRLKFHKAAIATGSRPASIAIPGLEAAGYLTNETIFQLVDRPAKLAVIGAGYIGCELAQTFRRLGSEVVLLYRGDRILTREDADAAAIVQSSFEQDGVQLQPNSQIDLVEQRGNQKILHLQGEQIAVDEILLSVGRSPNIEHLGLEAIGVEANPDRGIVVNDFLQTTNPRIYGVGDVCMQWKFTHAAHAAARIAIQNALFSVAGIGRKRLSSLVMPSCTYTDPEVAQVGMQPHEAQAQGIAIDTFQIDLRRVDRALIDGETAGFAKVHVRKGTDRIVGATIVARHAGDLITQITFAMTNRLGLRSIANTIYPYPTQAEAISNVAAAHGMTLLQKLQPITSRWMAWRR